MRSTNTRRLVLASQILKVFTPEEMGVLLPSACCGTLPGANMVERIEKDGKSVLVEEIL